MGKTENSKIENCFVFILGREQKIALAEIEAVLRRFCIYPEQSRAGFGFCTDKNHPERAITSRLGDLSSEGVQKDEPEGNPYYSIISLQDNIAIIKFPDSFQMSSESLMSQLGGTVKIFKIVDSFQPGEAVEKLLVGELAKNNTTGTLNFAISDYSGLYNVKQLSDMGIQIKIHARKRRPVRFVASRETELSSATSYHKIFKSGGEEFGIFKIAGGDVSAQYLIGKLIGVTNPDEWSERDYGKPAGDKYSGMMPPKLARMLVNLALGQIVLNNRETEEPKNNETMEQFNNQKPLVFDPFCGSGNVLMEALLLGCDVVGSDLSDKAVEDTRVNLKWLCQHPKLNENSKLTIDGSVFVADATSADFIGELKNRTTEEQKNLVIVTEPFLGIPKKFKNQKSMLKDEVRELKDLYLGFFRNLLKLTASSYNLEAICFIFPLIETSDSGTVSLYDECIDDLREMGYNPIRTLKYGRDYQIVKRQIVLFTINQ